MYFHLNISWIHLIDSWDYFHLKCMRTWIHACNFHALSLKNKLQKCIRNFCLSQCLFENKQPKLSGNFPSVKNWNKKLTIFSHRTSEKVDTELQFVLSEELLVPLFIVLHFQWRENEEFHCFLFLLSLTYK